MQPAPPRASNQVKILRRTDQLQQRRATELCRSLRSRGLNDVRWSKPNRHAPITGADREILDRLAADPSLQQIDLLFYRSIPDATSELAHLRVLRRDTSDGAGQIANMIDAQRRSAVREPRVECGDIGDGGFTHEFV
jgi:hypothetical protein